MSLGMRLNASKSVARAPQLQRPDRPGPFTGEYFCSSGEATYVRCDMFERQRLKLHSGGRLELDQGHRRSARRLHPPRCPSNRTTHVLLHRTDYLLLTHVSIKLDNENTSLYGVLRTPTGKCSRISGQASIGIAPTAYTQARTNAVRATHPLVKFWISPRVGQPELNEMT